MSDDWDPFADPADVAQQDTKGTCSSKNANLSGVSSSGINKGAKVGKDLNPYEILNIATDATDAIIKSAFRKASLKVHPDHCPDDADAAFKFGVLVDAKDFLLDPLRRRMYNLRHGIAQKTQITIWWSDWDDIFDEIDLAADEDDGHHSHQVPVSAVPSSRIDILILGVTGITGTLACAVLCSHAQRRTWAVAGRDPRKLQLIEEKFGRSLCFRGAHSTESPEDLDNLIAAATVVVDLRGPKSRIGTIAADTCISAGAHYIDVSSQAADIISIKATRDALDSAAKLAGVSLVFFCGWQATHKDLALWSLVGHVRDTYGLPTRRVDIYHAQSFGYLPGTTLQVFAEGPKSFSESQGHGAPFPLGGVRLAGVRDEDKPEQKPVEHKHYGVWVKTSQDDNEAWILRSSCGQFDSCHPYGENFVLKNWDLCGTDKISADRAILNDAFVKRNYKTYVEGKKIVPPGSGPKERIRKESHSTTILVAESDAATGNSTPEKSHGILNLGPGGVGDLCEGTALTALEAAYCILHALDQPVCTLRPGFGTPSYHLAHLGLLDRLRAIPGFSWHTMQGAPSRDLLVNTLSSSIPIAG